MPPASLSDRPFFLARSANRRTDVPDFEMLIPRIEYLLVGEGYSRGPGGLMRHVACLVC